MPNFVLYYFTQSIYIHFSVKFILISQFPRCFKALHVIAAQQLVRRKQEHRCFYSHYVSTLANKASSDIIVSYRNLLYSLNKKFDAYPIKMHLNDKISLGVIIISNKPLISKQVTQPHYNKT